MEDPLPCACSCRTQVAQDIFIVHPTQVLTTETMETEAILDTDCDWYPQIHLCCCCCCNMYRGKMHSAHHVKSLIVKCRLQGQDYTHVGVQLSLLSTSIEDLLMVPN